MGKREKEENRTAKDQKERKPLVLWHEFENPLCDD